MTCVVGRVVCLGYIKVNIIIIIIIKKKKNRHKKNHEVSTELFSLCIVAKLRWCW